MSVIQKRSWWYSTNFKSNFIQLCSWCAEGRCSQRMVWRGDRWRRWLQGWCDWGTVKNERWRMEGVGRVAQRRDGWHGCGRMAQKEHHRWYNIKMKDDTCRHRLKMKGRKTDEVSGSWEREEKCNFRGIRMVKYRQLQPWSFTNWEPVWVILSLSHTKLQLLANS